MQNMDDHELDALTFKVGVPSILMQYIDDEIDAPSFQVGILLKFQSLSMYCDNEWLVMYQYSVNHC